jgi:hypothetical protein
MVIADGKPYGGSLVSIAREGIIYQEAKWVSRSLAGRTADLDRANSYKPRLPDSLVRDLLSAESLNPTKKRIYRLPSTVIDDKVEMSRLNSNEVLATLFNLERSGTRESLFTKALL